MLRCGRRYSLQSYRYIIFGVEAFTRVECEGKSEAAPCLMPSGGHVAAFLSFWGEERSGRL